MAEVGDLYEGRIFCTLGVQTSITVRHWRVSGKTGTGATDAQIAAGLEGAVATAMKAVISASATYRGVGVRRIQPLPISLETYSNAAAGVGGLAGDPLPLQTAGIITIGTALGGRSRRGRAYIPFPNEDSNTASALPSNAYVALLATLGGALTATFGPGAGGNTNNLIAVVFSRKFNTRTDVSSNLPRTQWGTQRSRGGYGRPNPSPI